MLAKTVIMVSDVIFILPFNFTSIQCCKQLNTMGISGAVAIVLLIINLPRLCIH